MNGFLKNFLGVFLVVFVLLAAPCWFGDGEEKAAWIKLGGPYGMEISCVVESALLALLVAVLLAGYGAWEKSYGGEIRQPNVTETRRFVLWLLVIYLVVAFAGPTTMCVVGRIDPPLGIELGGELGRELSCGVGSAILTAILGSVLAFLILRSSND